MVNNRAIECSLKKKFDEFSYDSDSLSESDSHKYDDTLSESHDGDELNYVSKIKSIDIFDFDNNELSYFNNLNDQDQENIMNIKNRLQKTGINHKPLLFKILE